MYYSISVAFHLNADFKYVWNKEFMINETPHDITVCSVIINNTYTK